MINLRPYQQQGIDEVYEHFHNGKKRVVFQLQTGGGKTITFCKMVIESIAVGLPVVIVMRRRELIKQTSNVLDSFKIPHGVYMANHRRFRPNELVQVCSIDTLDARSLYPHEGKTKLNIIDESHDATPRGKKYARYFEKNSNDFFAGFTATPFTDNSLFEEIVCPIEAWELRDQGFLVPDRTYVPNMIDVSNVSIKRTGDYNERELFEAASNSAIIGDFVSDWKVYAQGRPTVLFAVNIEHSKIICEAFNEAGITSEHADASTKSHDRDRILSSLKSGKINVVTNVDIFSTGVDAPEISCVQLCRPTQSVVWHLQAIGRGLRTSPSTGKQNCIVIDNAGNTLRHGTAYKQREAKIGKPSKRKDSDEQDITIRTCKQCFFIFDSNIQQCPNCDYVNPKIKRKIKHEKGELVEYKMSPEEIELAKKNTLLKDYYKLEFVEKRKGFHVNWKYHKLKKKHDKDIIIKFGSLIDFPIEIIHS
jgi:superfamily II DNA or RNA helicase